MQPIYVMLGTSKQKEIYPISACLFSILLVLTSYFFMCLTRLSVRKAAKWEASGAESTNSLLQNEHIGLFTIYLILTYIGIVIWSYIGFWITNMN